jgi:hypothetical protein
MIEGTLKVEWANRDKPADTPRYWLTFTAHAARFGGGAHRKVIIGRESMLEYLLGIQAATLLAARQWLSEIHGAAGQVSLEHTQLTEEQYKPFRPVS